MKYWEDLSEDKIAEIESEWKWIAEWEDSDRVVLIEETEDNSECHIALVDTLGEEAFRKSQFTQEEMRLAMNWLWDNHQDSINGVLIEWR